MSKAEPRFDIDFKYGRQGELLVAEYLDWIAAGNGRVEVKRKRYLDMNFYVEQECDKGRTGTYTPSGINVTDADMWVYVIGNTGIALCIPTPVLREAIKHGYPKEAQEGSCPTKGTLVHMGAILQAGRLSSASAAARGPHTSVGHPVRVAAEPELGRRE